MSKSHEYESQMILRVPEAMSEKINNFLDSEEDTDDYVELVPQITKTRNGEEVTMFKFRIGDHEAKASLLDLPCVVESQKTIDDVNFFKSANISQMVYVHPNDEEDLDQGELKSTEL